MQTTIDIDDQLLEQAVRLSTAKSKQEAVAMALANFVKMLQRQQLLTLRGNVDWDGDIETMRAH